MADTKGTKKSSARTPLERGNAVGKRPMAGESGRNEWRQQQTTTRSYARRGSLATPRPSHRRLLRHTARAHTVACYTLRGSLTVFRLRHRRCRPNRACHTLAPSRPCRPGFASPAKPPEESLAIRSPTTRICKQFFFSIKIFLFFLLPPTYT